jgi:hypothetical protein
MMMVAAMTANQMRSSQLKNAQPPPMSELVHVHVPVHVRVCTATFSGLPQLLEADDAFQPPPEDVFSASLAAAGSILSWLAVELHQPTFGHARTACGLRQLH